MVSPTLGHVHRPPSLRGLRECGVSVGGRKIGEGGRGISQRVVIKATVRVYSPPAAMLASQGQGRRAVCEPAVRGRHEHSRQKDII